MDNSLNILPYTQHDLLRMKSTSQLLSRPISSTDPQMTTFDNMIKDLLINSKKVPDGVV